MYHKTLLASLLLISVQIANSQNQSYADVELEIKRGQLDVARATLDKVLAANDKDFMAHLFLGIVLQEEGHPEESIAQFYKARDLRPNNPASYVNIGKTLASQGRFGAAANQFSIALRLDPNNAAAHSNFGVLLYDQQRWHESIVHLRRAVSLAPADGMSWFVLFKAYLATRDFESARVVSRQIEHLTPASSETFRTLGALQGHAGDFAGAALNLQRALLMNPNSNEIAYNLSLAWLRQGDLEDARSGLEKLKTVHDDGEVEDLLAEIYEKQGHPLDAVRSLQRAVALDPQNEEYCFHYVLELLIHKNYDAAILIAKAAIQTFPGSLRLHLALVGGLYQARRNQEGHDAILETSQDFPDSSLPLYLRNILITDDPQADGSLVKDTKSYLARHPSDSLAFLVLGRQNGLLGDPTAAIPLLQKSVALDPEFADSHLALARAYSDLRDWKQVIVYSRKATILSPGNAQAWYDLARALGRIGRKQEADTAMAKFLTLHKQQQNPISTFLYTVH